MNNNANYIHSMKGFFKQIMSFFTIYSKYVEEHGNAIYRIIKLPNEKDDKIHFQLIGKNTVLKVTPNEILKKDLVFGFNKPDIIAITYLATKKDTKLQTKKIASEKFSEDGKRVFLVKDEKSGKHIEKTAAELFVDCSTKENFDTADGLKIGHSAAVDRLSKLDVREKKNITLKILERIFNEVSCQAFIEYENIKTRDRVKSTVDEIFYNTELLQQFSEKDQSTIAFTAGELSKNRILKTSL